MRTVTSLRTSFQTDHLAFCFDSPVLFRRQIFPKYKAYRRGETDSEVIQDKIRVRRVIDELWKQLGRAGFVNVFRSPGMESDDLMAKIAFTYDGLREGPDGDEKLFLVLVSSDKDLYQCLSERVILHMSGTMTKRAFENLYEIPPRAWARVKAIAGCKTDGVPGIPGIGENTALKYIRGQISSGAKLNKIRSPEGRNIIQRNRQLVELPAEGCPKIKLYDRDWSEDKWIRLAKKLKIKEGRIRV